MVQNLNIVNQNDLVLQLGRSSICAFKMDRRRLEYISKGQKSSVIVPSAFTFSNKLSTITGLVVFILNFTYSENQ